MLTHGFSFFALCVSVCACMSSLTFLTDQVTLFKRNLFRFHLIWCSYFHTKLFFLQVKEKSSFFLENTCQKGIMFLVLFFLFSCTTSFAIGIRITVLLKYWKETLTLSLVTFCTYLYLSVLLKIRALKKCWNLKIVWAESKNRLKLLPFS